MNKRNNPILIWILILMLITQTFAPISIVSATESIGGEDSSIIESISNSTENDVENSDTSASENENESSDNILTENGKNGDSSITVDHENSEEGDRQASESDENSKESDQPVNENNKINEKEDIYVEADMPQKEEKIPPLEQPPGLTPFFQLNGAPQVIPENLITHVVMKDGENGNPIEDIRPEQGSRVWIEYTWAVQAGHEYGAGSVFTFNLPDKFKTGIPLYGKLTGEVNAVYFVSPEGQVTFTFNEEIDDSTTGNFFVWRELDESKFSGGLKQEILFQHGESITVHFLPKKGTNEMSKSGTADRNMNPSKIDWVVDFNKHEKEIHNAIFQDTLPDGLEIDLNSIEVYELEVQLDGTVIQGAPYGSLIRSLRDNGGGFKLTFIDSPINKAYRVKYTTNVKPILEAPYLATFKNNAFVSGNENPNLMADAYTVKVEFIKPLGKSANHYDTTTQTITWAIQYNYNEQVIEQSNAWVVDTFDTTPQKLVDNSFEVYEMKIGNDGKATRKTGKKLSKGTDYDVVGESSGFKLYFKNQISSAYEIFYKTTAIDRVYDDVDIVNIVKMHEGTEVTVTRKIGQVIFSKSFVGIDYNKDTITWKISVNGDKKTMKSVIITDCYKNEGLILQPDSITIPGLTKGTDYTVVAKPTYDEGFIITFQNDITTNHDITYETTYNPTQYTPTAIKTISYKNTATIEWKEGDTSQIPITKTATANLNNDTKRNGVKTASYNVQTKEITWTVDVNYNRHVIKNAVVKDIYTGDQTFLLESLTVNKLTIEANGTKTVDAPHIVNDGDLTPVEVEGKVQGFTLKLGDINSAYRITYKTSLDKHPVAKQYSNKALLYAASDPDNLLFNESATVEPIYGGEYINKSGSQGNGAEAEFAYWTVNINRSQSSIDGAKVTDILSSNQILDKDSVTLYTTTVAADGKITKAAPAVESLYTVMVNGNELTVIFNEAIDRPYILEYKSFINAGDKEEISNHVTLTGQSTGIVNEKDEIRVPVYFAGAGGSASQNKGSIKIIKVDANTKAPLAGAVFELYDKTGNTLLESITTDVKGEAVFKGYRYGAYQLKEKVAPNGYAITAEYKDGKEIKLNKEVIEITVENKELKQGFTLTKIDKEEPTKTLAGATFKLQKKVEGGTYEDIEELTTNAAGIIAKGEVTPGAYQLIETIAPKGYKLDPTPIPFTIVSNQIKIIVLESKNEKLTMTNDKKRSGGSSSSDSPGDKNPKPKEDPKNNEEETPDEPGKEIVDPDQDHTNTNHLDGQPVDPINQKESPKILDPINNNPSTNEQPTKRILPQTGEYSSKLPWIGLVLCLIGIALWIRRSRWFTKE
ncbi:MAG TPA: collagen binding domain-containing protein [Bacillales bacterium]|nr:collagen binding domain-containing protein [Bacillales bacterium]